MVINRVFFFFFFLTKTEKYGSWHKALFETFWHFYYFLWTNGTLENGKKPGANSSGPTYEIWYTLLRMWIIVKYFSILTISSHYEIGFSNWESNWWKGAETHWYPIGSRFLWLLRIWTKIKGDGYSYSKSYPDIWAYFFEVSYCLTSEIIPNWDKKQKISSPSDTKFGRMMTCK